MLQCPKTEQEWKIVAEGFNQRWNFPNCIGAVDGKHVTVQPPANSGSQFFNYKHQFSVVLMAVVDSDYTFLYVDVGSNGRVSDGGVFKQCSFKEGMMTGLLNIPPPEVLPGTDFVCPFMLVADEAFPLTTNIMKPFPMRGLTKEQKVFNYRLSRARRVVENGFGILANRFRVFHTAIALCADKVELIVHASCALHNMLRATSSEYYIPPGAIDRENVADHTVTPGSWRQNGGMAQADIDPTYNRNPTAAAKEQRVDLADYFNSDAGSVAWQLAMIH